MATYRVSPTLGVDSAGRSGSTSEPWATWAYLDSRVSAASGDVYLQDAGTVARENIPTSIVAAGNITLGVYGDSDYATILGSDVVSGFTWNATYGLWQRTISNGWNITVDGQPLAFVPWTTNLATTAALMGEWSFSYDPTGGVLYVRAPESPDGAEVSARQFVIGESGSSQTGLTIEGFKLLGAYRHNILLGTKTGGRIRECYFGVCGGEYASAYLGNQIELYEDNVDWVIEDSIFVDAFDTAISPQLRNISSKTLRSHIYRRNTMRRFGYAGVEGTMNGASQRIDGVQVLHNVIEDGGRGWSGDRGARGVMISNNNLSTANVTAGCLVAFNEIRRCKTGILMRDTAGGNVIGPNEIEDVQYGIVSRQQVAASGHVDQISGVVVRRASVAGYYVSGSADGVHGSVSATQALAANLTNVTFVDCAEGVVNTTNANAAVAAKNVVFLGSGAAFDVTVGTFAESKSVADTSVTPGRALDSSSMQIDLDEFLNADGSLRVPYMIDDVPMLNPLGALGTYVQGARLQGGRRLQPARVPVGAFDEGRY